MEIMRGEGCWLIEFWSWPAAASAGRHWRTDVIAGQFRPLEWLTHSTAHSSKAGKRLAGARTTEHTAVDKHFLRRFCWCAGACWKLSTVSQARGMAALVSTRAACRRSPLLRPQCGGVARRNLAVPRPARIIPCRASGGDSEAGENRTLCQPPCRCPAPWRLPPRRAHQQAASQSIDSTLMPTTSAWPHECRCRASSWPAPRPPPATRTCPSFATVGVPPALTLGEAYATLGLSDISSYEDVLAAKNRLVEKYRDDFERRMEVGPPRPPARPPPPPACMHACMPARLPACLPVAPPTRTRPRFVGQAHSAAACIVGRSYYVCILWPCAAAAVAAWRGAPWAAHRPSAGRLAHRRRWSAAPVRSGGRFGAGAPRAGPCCGSRRTPQTARRRQQRRGRRPAIGDKRTCTHIASERVTAHSTAVQRAGQRARLTAAAGTRGTRAAR